MSTYQQRTTSNLQVMESPFEPLSTTKTIISPFNLNNDHWLVFRANREQGLLELFDSIDGVGYRSTVSNALLEVLEAFWPLDPGKRWQCE